MSADRSDSPPSSRRGLAGRVLGGRYRVTRMVSAGANTLIADAHDTEVDRPVTVKLIRPELAEQPDFRERFRAEMRIVSSLSHPNIAAVHDFGEDVVGKRRTVYVVVEQLSGGSLRDLRDRGRDLDPSQALLVGLEACRGLDFAHRKGLTHSELTPSKLVFGDDRRLRIVDFGLAHLLAEHDWREPSRVATHVARYASPEQAQARPIDGKSDVYSLGLILVEAVTGQVPFAASSTVATLTARVGKLMPVSADLGPLASVLERAGRPEPADRWTAAELGRALVRAAERLPRPKPIPIVVVSPFEEDPNRLRRPNDPTGGITRPPAPTAETVAPVVEPETAIEPVPEPEVDPAVEPVTVVPAAEADETVAFGVPRAPDAPSAKVYDGDSDRTRDELAALVSTAPEPTVRVDEPAPDVGPVEPDPPGDRDEPPWTDRLESLDERPRRRWLAWLVGLVLLGALGALGYLAWTLFGTPRHEVPDLVGRDEAAARAEAERFDWVVDVQRERSDEEPDVGQIIRTSPAAGDDLAEGEPFLVIISEGPELRVLPEVTGLTLAEAETALAERQLAALPPREINDEEVPPGVVVSWSVPSDQALAAGAEVLPGTEIRLVLSIGPAPRAVPDLVGLTVADARNATGDLQLELVVEPGEFSDEVPKGQLISQRPRPGREVERGAAITVVPSKGVDAVPVPSLEGTNLRQARRRLEEAGLRVGAVLGQTSGDFVSASVNGERVESGDQIRRGTPIDLIFL